MKLPELKAVVGRREYSVEVTVAALLRIMKRDKTADRSLAYRIDQLDGVSNTDYDGHFGPYIFYRVDAEDDTPELHEKVYGLIRGAVA